MVTDEVRVEAAALEAFTRDVFIRVGMPSEDAAVEAEVLVWANLRGVDSHGVLRIPSYVEMVNKGDMNPRPKIQVVKETAATVLIDADHAFGPVVTVQATRHAIAKARFKAEPTFWSKIVWRVSFVATRAAMPYGIMALAIVNLLPMVVFLAAVGANVYWISLVLKLRDLLGNEEPVTA